MFIPCCKTITSHVNKEKAKTWNKPVEKDMSCSDECWHKPFIKFVHSFQVHVAGQPHVFIDEIESCMGDELVQVAMIVLQSIRHCIRYQSAVAWFCDFFSMWNTHVKIRETTYSKQKHWHEVLSCYLWFWLPTGQKLHLKHWVVLMANHDEIKTSRHVFLPLVYFRRLLKQFKQIIRELCVKTNE